MSRDLSANITTEIGESAQKPMDLYIVFLDIGTLYFTSYPNQVNFFSWDTTTDEMSSTAQTYIPVAISHGDIKTSADNKIDQVQVGLDNVNRLMSAYIANTEFRSRRMIILRVYQEYLTNYQDYVVLFDGIMDSPLISETAMEVTLKSRIGTLSLYVPRRIYDVGCNWRFGSEECGYGKSATGISGIPISSGTSLVLYQDDISYNSEYWKYGDINFTSAGSNTGERRQIIASSGLGYLTGTHISGLVLLSKFDGADGATAYTAETGQIATFLGTAQLDNARVKMGTTSLYLDGNSDYVTFPQSTDWNLRTNNFSLETWVNFYDVTGYQMFIGQRVDNNNYWAFYKADSAGGHHIVFISWIGAGYQGRFESQNWTPVSGTWYHFAFARSGNTPYMFINGVPQTLSTVAPFGDVSGLSTTLNIGYHAALGYTNGWMAQPRIFNGVAKWTSAFTPVPASYGLTGTKLFLDYSLPSGASAGDTFTMQRGCDKTFTWCSGLSNLINFGGFQTIPQEMVIR